MTRKGWVRHLDFMLVDVCMLLISFLVGVYSNGHFGKIQGYAYRDIGVMLTLVHLIVVFLLDSYNGIVGRGYLKEMYAVIKQVCLVFGCFIFILYLFQDIMWLPRQVAVSIVYVNLALTYLGRVAWKTFLKYRYSKMKHTRQIFVITVEKEAEKMMNHITSNTIKNYTVRALAIVDRDMIGQKIGSVEVNASRDSLRSYVTDRVIDEVFINIPLDSEYEYRVAKTFLDMGSTVHIYMQRNYESFPNREMGRMFGYDVLTSSISRMTFRQLLLKRLMDIAGGCVGLVLTALIGAVVAPLIYFHSPGPILFSQVRVGKAGRRFRIYKFRSMYMDAEARKQELMEQNEGDPLMFKMENDPRIIKGIGNFIRKTSIDEMPQFWNVLRGDMSLVGTRPPTEEEYIRYEWHHKKRLSIKPGLTGLWQISGRNNITDFEDVVRLDTQYIEQYSLELDVKILLKTVFAVLRKEGR